MQVRVTFIQQKTRLSPPRGVSGKQPKNSLGTGKKRLPKHASGANNRLQINALE
jgi:hypothetical protein